ncbi:MAG: A/G-specific adenine glycosylase [Peptococcaceae bacterium]|nr:A/G-specific adenine glycosylase [Peptococcaceae bacterium]
MPRENGRLFPLSEYAPRLLAWYEDHGRDLPWRVKGGPHPDPYIVWVSEIMLQQTTVAAVVPYFQRFMERFPDLAALAAALPEDVLVVWQGLGYYRRAHQLHACAQRLWEQHGGIFPRPLRPDDLCELPGIGAYTAASIAALAFDMPAAVVDGNVARILSRLYCVGVPLATVKDRVAAWARELLPEEGFADYTSAIMDLGAVVCRPQNPLCSECPWRDGCGAWARGESDRFPVKQRREKPGYAGIVYWLEDESGRVFVRRRTEGGLLRGLSEFPWVKSAGELAGAVVDGVAADSVSTAKMAKICWEETGRSVRHTFTHFHLTLRILRGSISSCVLADNSGLVELSSGLLSDGSFVPVSEFPRYPFSNLMRKVIDEMGCGM